MSTPECCTLYSDHSSLNNFGSWLKPSMPELLTSPGTTSLLDMSPFHTIPGTAACRDRRSESTVNPTTAARMEPGTLDKLLDTIINAKPVPTGGDASTGLSPGTKLIIILLLYLTLMNSILVVSSVTI
ncbi:hypothetical protein BKA82DRAFT_4015001 [Pisolithus tinctorius]|nr:hypothetical protein BKA82DRAFT_4015001 [Pisolithus tinctorius]